MGVVLDATREDFRDLVADGLVLVDVWGPSCQRCLALFPWVEALAAEHPDLRVVKLEAPKARRLCIELRLMGLPAFLLFRGGEEMARLSAPDLTAERLAAWLHGTLATVRSGHAVPSEQAVPSDQAVPPNQGVNSAEREEGRRPR